MKIISKLINQLGAKHGKNLGKLIDRQEEPELFKAVISALDNKLSIFTGSSIKINPEYEMMQNMLFDGMGLGFLDNILDILKYGKYAFKTVQYKAMPYVLEYRQSLFKNLPPLHSMLKKNGKPKLFIKEDFRKEEITPQEVEDILKQMLFAA